MTGYQQKMLIKVAPTAFELNENSNDLAENDITTREDNLGAKYK